MASMKGERPSQNIASGGKRKKLSNLFAKKELLNTSECGSKLSSYNNFTRKCTMVLRSSSKDRSSNKSSNNNKSNLSGWTFSSVKNDVKEKSQLSSSINNLLKVVNASGSTTCSSKRDADIDEECSTTKPVDVTQKQIFDHCSLSSSLGNRISRSIYDLTSVERLKRWKAKLPSVRHKPNHHHQHQQQQQKILGDTADGTIPPSGTLSQMHSPNFGNVVDSAKNGRNSQTTTSRRNDMENKITAIVDDLSSITVLYDSTLAQSNRFADQPRLSSLNVEKQADDDGRPLLKFGGDNSTFNNNLDQRGCSSNRSTTNADVYCPIGNNYSSNPRTNHLNRNHKENLPTTTDAAQLCETDINLLKIHINSTKNTKNGFSTEYDENADVYEELDCYKQTSKLISPVKLAPYGGILNEMSALPRPSAFRPFKSSKNASDTKLPETVTGTQTLDRSSLYDNFVLKSKSQAPSPPPRRCNGSNRNLHSDLDTPSSRLSSSSDKPGYDQRTYLPKTDRVQNSSPSRNIVQPGFYKSFVTNVPHLSDCSDMGHPSANNIQKPFSNGKAMNPNRFPNVSNVCNYVIPSSITDSGVSMQNYSRTCSFSSRNSSGMSDSGLAEVENVYKNKDAELSTLRQSMEQNEQVIVQVYKEKEQKWQNKLKQWSTRVEQSIEVEQNLLTQIEHLKDDQSNLHGKVQTLRAEKQGLQRKCKELESELFTLKQQINEKRKHWEICRDCGKIFVPDAIMSSEKHNMQLNPANISNNAATPSLDGTMSTKAPTMSEELRSEMDILKQEVTNVKSALQQQIDKFSKERQIWESEKRQVLDCHKMLEDNYGWLVHNNNNTPSKLKSNNSFREISSNF